MLAVLRHHSRHSVRTRPALFDNWVSPLSCARHPRGPSLPQCALLIAALTLAGAGCECSRDEDGGPRDSGTAPDASLPAVERTGPACDDVSLPASRACLERGWFSMPQWSTAPPEHIHRTGAGAPLPRRPVYLDAFGLDRHEVTNDEYAAFVSSGGALAPTCDGSSELIICGPCEGGGSFPMRTPWEGGALSPGYGDHPVLCVSIEDAAAFCAARGGRLPTYVEWLRALVGPLPGERRFPWGTEDELPDWRRRLFGPEVFIEPRDSAGTRPVGAEPRGATPEGVDDLLGNASELVAGCPEALAVDTAPWIRPDISSCAPRHLVAGVSWFSPNDVEAGPLGYASGVYEVDAEGAAVYPEEAAGLLSYANVMGHDPVAVSEGRSWRRGFRCAYDLD